MGDKQASLWEAAGANGGHKTDLNRLISLIKSGQHNINATNWAGMTPLHSAAPERNTGEVLKWLLENGAEVNKATPYGLTPLHFACYYGRIDNVRQLLAFGADFSARTEDGKTPKDKALEGEASSRSAKSNPHPSSQYNDVLELLNAYEAQSASNRGSPRKPDAVPAPITPSGGAFVRFCAQIEQLLAAQRQTQAASIDPTKRELDFAKFLEDISALVHAYQAKPSSSSATNDSLPPALLVPTERSEAPKAIPNPKAYSSGPTTPNVQAPPSSQPSTKKRYSQGTNPVATQPMNLYPQPANPYAFPQPQLNYQFQQQQPAVQKPQPPAAQVQPPPAQPPQHSHPQQHPQHPQPQHQQHPQQPQYPQQYRPVPQSPQLQQYYPQQWPTPVQGVKTQPLYQGQQAPQQSSRSSTPTTQNKAEIRVNLASVAANAYSTYSPHGTNPPSSRSMTSTPTGTPTGSTPNQMVVYEEQKKGRETPTTDGYAQYRQYMETVYKAPRPTSASFSADFYARSAPQPQQPQPQPQGTRPHSAYSAGHTSQPAQSQRPTSPQWGQQANWPVPSASYSSPQSNVFGSFGNFGSVPYSAPTLRYY